MHIFKYKLISRYIMWHVVKATLLVFFIILGIYIFVVFTGEIGDVGKGNYDLSKIAKFVLMVIPLKIYNIFPIIGLLGSLIGLGLLSRNREVMIMRSSGVSVMSICGAVLIPILFMIIIVFIIGERFAPYMSLVAHQQKAIAIGKNQALRTSKGIWMKVDHDFIYIGKILSNSHLQNVIDYHFNDNYNLKSASSAKYVISRNNKWYFQDLSTTYFSGDESINVVKAKQKLWHINIKKVFIKSIAIDAENMSLLELYNYISSQKKNNIDIRNFELVFWKRLLQPLTSLVMISLSLPFIFGALRSVTTGVRIVIGTSVGIVFYLFNFLLGSLSLTLKIPLLLIVLLPIIIFGIISLYLIWRVK